MLAEKTRKTIGAPGALGRQRHRADRYCTSATPHEQAQSTLMSEREADELPSIPFSNDLAESHPAIASGVQSRRERLSGTGIGTAFDALEVETDPESRIGREVT